VTWVVVVAFDSGRLCCLCRNMGPACARTGGREAAAIMASLDRLAKFGSHPVEFGKKFRNEAAVETRCTRWDRRWRSKHL
jgi:hypothetical protein